MPDYMLTVFANGEGHRDIQVNGAPSIREAIAVAEKETRCRVSHGRGGIGSLFDPAIIIDYATGNVERLHDRSALTSTQIAMPGAAGEVRAAMTVPRGAGVVPIHTIRTQEEA